jgi:di/tricarboxylate transporter
MTTIQMILLIGMVLAVALGFVTKTNAGIWAMIVAYVVGSFLMGIKPSAIVAMWPTRIFFILFSVTFFYNFATGNGTLEKLASMILHRFHRIPALIPFIIFLVAFLISFMGAGFYAVVALLCPLSFEISKRSKINPLVGAIAVLNGALAGGQFITTATGSVIREIIVGSSYPEQATLYTMYVFVTTTAGAIISLIATYFVFRTHKVKAADISIDKPEPFTAVQKKSLVLVIAMLVLVISPLILSLLLPENAVIKTLEKFMDVGFVALILGILSSILKLGDEKKALKNVPWNTIILISGMGILIALATEAGLIDTLAQAVAGVGNPLLIGILISAVAGIMSIFSSTVGVVLPTLYPVVASLSAATGISAPYLFVAINAGSTSTGISPFSSGGGLVMGCAPDEETQQYLYPRLIAATGVFFVTSFVYALAYYIIF